MKNLKTKNGRLAIGGMDNRRLEQLSPDIVQTLGGLPPGKIIS